MHSHVLRVRCGYSAVKDGLTKSRCFPSNVLPCGDNIEHILALFISAGHVQQAAAKEVLPAAAKLSEVKENQRPAMYNVDASALHFSKPSKVFMSYPL